MQRSTEETNLVLSCPELPFTPVLHMQSVHTGEPVARSTDALARPAANNMPLSEHDTQELRRLLYLKAEGIERQERLQYLRQTWKYSIWSEEDDESYTLPDPEIPLVYSLHYGQECPPEWDDGTVPAETADRHKKKDKAVTFSYSPLEY